MRPSPWPRRIDTPRMALAPSRPLLGLPSSLIMAAVPPGPGWPTTRLSAGRRVRRRRCPPPSAHQRRRTKRLVAVALLHRLPGSGGSTRRDPSNTDFVEPSASTAVTCTVVFAPRESKRTSRSAVTSGEIVRHQLGFLDCGGTFGTHAEAPEPMNGTRRGRVATPGPSQWQVLIC